MAVFIFGAAGGSAGTVRERWHGEDPGRLRIVGDRLVANVQPH